MPTHTMHDRAALTASQEDYLEAIFQLLAEKPVARSKDIAARLGVKPASVTGALRQLAAQGCVEHAPYDFVTLTALGRRLAGDVVKRHTLLGDFLSRILGFPKGEADDAACKLEHALPANIQQRLVRFVQFLDACPQSAGNWQERFQFFLEHGQLPASCAACAPCAGSPAPEPAAESRPKPLARRRRALV